MRVTVGGACVVLVRMSLPELQTLVQSTSKDDIMEKHERGLHHYYRMGIFNIFRCYSACFGITKEEFLREIAKAPGSISARWGLTRKEQEEAIRAGVAYELSPYISERESLPADSDMEEEILGRKTFISPPRVFSSSSSSSSSSTSSSTLSTQNAVSPAPAKRRVPRKRNTPTPAPATTTTATTTTSTVAFPHTIEITPSTSTATTSTPTIIPSSSVPISSIIIVPTTTAAATAATAAIPSSTPAPSVDNQDQDAKRIRSEEKQTAE
eukprot:TRINITY_DN6980_c0_g1_i2.p1 TRINITY_DN6980_c0_g1~~TRINITY_DN6980_c0_g1_i2.p1  ORF type:complete len:267 (-),score=87.67 TRINITY_DN6980_c0_g1_i2:70-870(-)